MLLFFVFFKFIIQSPQWWCQATLCENALLHQEYTSLMKETSIDDIGLSLRITSINRSKISPILSVFLGNANNRLQQLQDNKQADLVKTVHCIILLRIFCLVIIVEPNTHK